MFESSYPLVFLAWFLGGFINGVSGMGAAMVALPIVACVLEMSEAVPATCLVAVTLAVYVAWMYRAHSRVAPIIPMLLGCIPGLIIGVCVLRVVPGIWLQGGLGAALIVYVAWQLLHRAVRRTPRACGAAPYRGSHRGSPTRRSASAGRQWRSMRSTLAGTRTLLAGRSACIFLASASAPALFKPPPDCILPSWSRPHFGGCPARWWGSSSPCPSPVSSGRAFSRASCSS